MANTNKFIVKNGLNAPNIELVSPNETKIIQMTVGDDGALSFIKDSQTIFLVDNNTSTIPYNNITSGLTAVTIQNAIDEMSSGLLYVVDGDLTDPLSIDADTFNGQLPTYYTNSSNINYSNTISGLTATNVKNAIDELDTTLDGLNSTINAKLINRSMTLALSDETTDVTTGTSKITFRAPFAMTLYKIPRASLSIASSSGNPTVDINKNGVSIFSTTLSIDATEKTSVTAATTAVLSTTSIADDDEISLDIDVAGTGARGLKVTIYYRLV